MKRHEVIPVIALLLFGMVTIILALKLPIGTFRMAGTGLFPLCMGILLMILSGIYLLKGLGSYKQALEKKTASGAHRSLKQLVPFLGTMVLATLLLNYLGYLLVSFLLMLALSRILGMKRWGLSILISGVTAAASYALFVQWLQIPLPKGFAGF